jgi:hypothetical protein
MILVSYISRHFSELFNLGLYWMLFSGHFPFSILVILT